jgi:hypothetical protein
MDRTSMIAEKIVAVKLDTRKEVQKYKQEHNPRPGTRVQVRNKQEMKKRYKEKASETMDRVDKIAGNISRTSTMAVIYSLKKVGDVDVEMLLDVTTGFLQVGMGGEWWNGVIRPGKTTLHHRKEHGDPAYKPVDVIVASHGYEVRIDITGGFYGSTEFNFLIAVK